MTYQDTSASSNYDSNLSKRVREKFPTIKENINESFKTYEKNYKRFNEFVRFVCVSTLTEQEISVLGQLGKPPVQFNILEAMVSKQRGEFMTHEPSINVKAADGVNVMRMGPQFEQMIEVLEAHLREIITNASNDQLQYRCYSDLLIGGFTAVEIYTDYVNSFSFEQNIYMEKCYNPCLVGFDPKAKTSHKGDGDFCFKVVPLTKQEFIDRFGEKAAKDIKFYRYSDMEGFQWSYKDSKKEIVLIAEYFEKRKKKDKLVKLAETQALYDQQIKQMLQQFGITLRESMLKKDYDKMIEVWPTLFPYNIPPMVIDERMTTLTTIEKFVLCESHIMEHYVTDFEHLPLVFISGNSVVAQAPGSNAYEEVTRPLVYHAKGLQKMKDFAGQTWIAEIENMMQSKLIISEESIPDDPDYQEAYVNPQKASTYVYKGFKDSNPNVPLNPPIQVRRDQTPQIVPEAFMIADRLAQSVLGSYDAELGIQNQEMSGKAIRAGAMQSSAAAKPYLMGYIQGLNRIAEIIVSLIPKYYVTPRTIPVLNSDGKRDYVMINDERNPDSIMMHYDSKDLMVKVEAGPSSGVQKEIAMENMLKLMQINPKINKFMAEDGAEILLDNSDFKGIDRLKAAYAQWNEKMQAKEQQQQQIQQQDQMLDMQQKQASVQLAQATGQASMIKAQSQAEKVKHDTMLKTAQLMSENQQKQNAEMIDAAKVAIAKQEADNDSMETVAKIAQAEVEAQLRAEEVAAENARTAVDGAIKASEHLHKISVDRHNMAKDMLESAKVRPSEE